MQDLPHRSTAAVAGSDRTLTHEGDKHAEGFDFTNLATNLQTVFQWHIKHFQSPPTVVPESIMPEMNFQSRQAQALAMLVMSWRTTPSYPGPTCPVSS